MCSKIKTAVLPAGGYGTRFLPVTKSIPKEMLPLYNKPIILHIVEEVVNAGIENIIFVVSHHKQAIEKLFAPDETLEGYYEKIDKVDKSSELKKISKLANFTFIYTEWPHGNGGALLSARRLLNDEPFVLIWTDEMIVSKKKSRIKQCLEVYNKFKLPVISMVNIDDESMRKNYGMAELGNFSNFKNIKKIKKIVEKPGLGYEPSVYAAHGAYILTPNIFEAMDKIKLSSGKDLKLVDIINKLIEESTVLGCIIKDGVYLDCGSPLNYLYSQINYALEFCEQKDKLKQFIENKF